MTVPDGGSDASCRSCGRANRDGARFCAGCGASLAPVTTCPSCGAEQPEGERFCDACGHRLAIGEPARPSAAPPGRIGESAAQLAGERKLITVLFLDVQGSMKLTESVEDEVWRDVMTRFFTLVCDGVQRFEGTVDKFTGDGAMALFGAPVALEDHAVRACWAALHLRDELATFGDRLREEFGLEFRVRMGLNSGEVVVGGVGGGQHMVYTAMGNTVALAARMEVLAEPGRPRLTQHTAALVDGFLDLEDLGTVDVKGAPAPVRVFALLGAGPARTRLEAAGTLSRFVGREGEMAVLDHALSAVRSGGGQVVGLVAEPGVGKTRLCFEFIERCRAGGVEVVIGRGIAHGRRVPLLPVIAMLRGVFGIGDQDDARVGREKVAERLRSLDLDLQSALPVLLEFLGVADPDEAPQAASPQLRQRLLSDAVRRLVDALSSRGSAVVVIEDLHWLDPGSATFLEHLVESLPGTRTLLVVNFRPEYDAPWMRTSYYQQVPLRPLASPDIAELADDLLGSDPSLDGLAELIADRTAGNPLFIEELVRTLAESGSLEGDRGAYRLARAVDDLRIPPTVHAVLAARIDRLPERDRRVLQAAAVIGKEFSEPVLRRVTGLREPELTSALAALRAAEFVYERGLHPDAQYAFKHPLTEEVAYRTQLREQRASLHAAVAQAIEEAAAPDRLDEQAAVLANHCEQAGDTTAAAQWSARAAVWAGQHHPGEALRHWRRAHALADRSTTDGAGLAMGAGLWLLHLGWRMGMTDADLEGVYRETATLADASGIPLVIAGVRAAYANCVGMRGRPRRALDVAREGLALCEGEADPALGAVLVYWLDLLGRPREALTEWERNWERVRDDPRLGFAELGLSLHVWMLVVRSGNLLWKLGRLDEMAAEADRALAAAKREHDVENIGWSLGMRANLAWARGEAGEALADARAALELSERVESSLGIAFASVHVALAHITREEWHDAAQAADHALRLMRSTRVALPEEAFALALRAHARLALGDTAGAEDAEAACRLADQREQRGAVVFGQWVLAQALAGTDTARAGAVVDSALRECVVAFPSLEPHLLMVRAGLRRRDDRHDDLQEALRLFRAQGATGWARRVEAELPSALPLSP